MHRYERTYMYMYIYVHIHSRLYMIVDNFTWHIGPPLNMKTVYAALGNSVAKIGRCWDRLIFMVRRHIYIETAPRFLKNGWHMILLGVPTLTGNSNGTINDGFWIFNWPYLFIVMLYPIFGNTKIVLHARSFLNMEMAQVYVTLPHGRQ